MDVMIRAESVREVKDCHRRRMTRIHLAMPVTRWTKLQAGGGAMKFQDKEKLRWLSFFSDLIEFFNIYFYFQL